MLERFRCIALHSTSSLALRVCVLHNYGWSISQALLEGFGKDRHMGLGERGSMVSREQHPFHAAQGQELPPEKSGASRAATSP
jgi:hypothetical protein